MKSIYNQSALQAFHDCPRKFQLRYLENLSWPAAETASLLQYEEAMQRGTTFHLLCQQFLSGVPAAKIKNRLNNGTLERMWSNFINFIGSLTYLQSFPEVLMSSTYFQHRITAKFDLILQINENQYLIVDYKTSQKLPSRTDLEDRIQTLIYPLVFQDASPSYLNINPLPCNQIQFQYWFAQHPESDLIFNFSRELRKQYLAKLQKILDTIHELSLSRDDFPKTSDHQMCRFCIYRSLCDRGEQPGKLELAPLLEYDEDFARDFDVEQIAEVEF